MMLAIEMLDDEGAVTEIDDAEFFSAVCEDCEEERLCYVWTSSTGIRYAVCAPHLDVDPFARLVTL